MNICRKGEQMKTLKKYKFFILMLVIIILFRTFVLERIIISGESMSPTLNDGNVVWAWKNPTPDRNDIVIIRINGKLYIKRIVGMPEETVEIKNGKVLINGVELQEEFEVMKSEEQKIQLKENEYFVLGDNRNNSTDSRLWGAIDKEQITGEVVFKFFPFWKMKKI